MEKYIFKIGSYRDIVVPIEVVAKSGSIIQYAIRLKALIIIFPISTADVPVYYASAKLPGNRDFLLKPKHYKVLGYTGGVYLYIANSNILFVQVRNSIK